MFKNYTSNDNLLLPPCLGDFIPQNDPVRVVHRIIAQINLEELYRRYSPKGCSAYHPRMMLQILVYAYLRNIYSSRRIEEFCRNDIRFMWLTGNVTPDHNTINRFRSSRLKDVLKTIFATIVKFLVSEGLVSLDVACTDGTKMEADANRYTFVWGKSIHTRISRIAEQLEEIWRYAESVTKQELRDSAPITYQDITPEKVEKALCRIDDALNGVDADRKMKAKVKRVRKSWPAGGKGPARSLAGCRRPAPGRSRSSLRRPDSGPASRNPPDCHSRPGRSASDRCAGRGRRSRPGSASGCRGWRCYSPLSRSGFPVRQALRPAGHSRKAGRFSVGFCCHAG